MSQLFAGERFLAHISLDKPLYKPGETLYARAIVLDAFTQATPKRPVLIQFQLKSPKGEIVHSSSQSAEPTGVTAFSFALSKEAVGGEYKLEASFPADGFAKSERSFTVKAYRPPRLKSDLEFVKKAYGPGDTVAATLDVKRAEGGIPVGAAVTAIATIDGAEVHRAEHTLDSNGRCETRFSLPASIAEGEGTLSMIIRDGGVQETAAKTIPLSIQKLSIEFYPEGGDLVVGLLSRVYFEAKTSKGKPADISGRIIDKSGATLTTFRSEHEGRGSTSFTPNQAGQGYTAVIDEPSGVSDLFLLPAVKSVGAVLSLDKVVCSVGDSLEVSAEGKGIGAFSVSISLRDREVLKVPSFTKSAALQIPDVHGVLRVTLFDEKGLPRAERLLFQRPKKTLQVEVTATPERAGLRDKVTVTVKTHSLDGTAQPAIVALSAVDDAVLSTIEKRERSPRLPAQAYLENEVAELFDANVYLAPGEERKLELLLSTQGWRRFAFSEADAFLQKHKERAERVLALHRPMPVRAPMMIPMPAPGGAPMPRPAAPQQRMVPVQAAVPAPVLAPAPVMKAAFALPLNDDGVGLDDVLAEKFDAELLDIPALQPPANAAPILAMPPMVAPMPMPMPDIAAGIAPMGAIAPQEEKRGLLARIGGFFGLGPKPEPIPAPVPPPMRPMPNIAPPVMMPVAPSVPVFRVYAHSAKTTPGRTDFTETLLWHAGDRIVGSHTFSFDLCDSITSFKVQVDAYTEDGALGTAETIVEARKPFFLEPKLPFEVTYGDLCEAPVAVINGTSKPLSASISAEVTGALRVLNPQHSLSLTPEERSRFILPLVVGHGLGQSSVTLTGKAGEHHDQITKEITVAPEGFPQAQSFGGKLSSTLSHSIMLDAEPIAGSVTIEAFAYPGPLASLQQAVAALLREPCGCFEQTSSSAYPNVMVMQYLSTHAGVDPQIVKRAQDLLERGYKRLISYECKEKGYEWFGGDPGHEALTAYGLMEFTDMAQVFPVDGAMLKRTQSWLLSRRDGSGGFTRNPRALDTFGGAPQNITNAYITWALTQAKVSDLGTEINALKEQAKNSEDPYFLALVAGVLLGVGDSEANNVLSTLAAKQKKSGEFNAAQTSITGSGGDSLTIETTALAILAFLQSPSHTAVVESAMSWLLERCKHGSFGATQSTILALKAIVSYDAMRAAPKRAGFIRLLLDGAKIAEARFTEEQQGAIPLSWVGSSLAKGAHQLIIEAEGADGMPYSVQLNYNTAQPASAAGCSVSLKTSLSHQEIKEGESLDLVTTIENVTRDGLPMVVAILGLPGGVEPRVDQLKELVKEGRFDAFELRNREIILYWRGMAPRAEHNLRISLLASIPGRYAGPASRAYLYYTDELKFWAAPLSITIQAQK
jgi:hypothetical protein